MVKHCIMQMMSKMLMLNIFKSCVVFLLQYFSPSFKPKNSSKKRFFLYNITNAIIALKEHVFTN